MQPELKDAILGVIQSSEAGDASSLANAVNDLKEATACRYCGGTCDLQPFDSDNLCDGYAGDVDGLYGPPMDSAELADQQRQFEKFSPPGD